MELSWGGPFTKSVETPKKKMRTTYDMDSASTNGE
jgi:predicted acylesterase/phospholipase RssA